jgi:hypothetical protein
MSGFNLPLTINLIGHTAGALLFAIFLALLFSRRGWSGERGRNLSGLAAALAVIWNLGSLLVLLLPDPSAPGARIAAAVSFSALSLLPAVLLHVWLQGAYRRVAAAAYLLSGAAMAMHVREVRTNDASLHHTAILAITIGFVLLTGIAVVLRGGGGRLAASMSLALFAGSFIHFGEAHAARAWGSELLIHHAGIPLALFVLLQDYRFVLLDAFVRFLANALLAAVLTAGIVLAGLRLLSPAEPDPVRLAAVAVGLCLCLVLFAWLRGRLLGSLTRALFGQGGLREAAARVRTPPAFESDAEYLEWAAALVADAARALHFRLTAQDRIAGAADLRSPVLARAVPGLSEPADALVPVRLAKGDSRLILLGPRRGGQRYLHDDLDLLAAAASEIAAHVESMRRGELARLAAQAELRALQAQIHPHFLFNALNTLYGTIPREAAGARRMVLNLADIFRYFLQSERALVPLAREMEIVRTYLEVEQSRLGPRLTVEITVDDAALDVPIPVLSIQPLVENAIKHGIARRAGPGYVAVEVRAAGGLRVIVRNSTGEGAEPGPGVGLRNMRRRLEICYGPAAALDLHVGGDTAVAELRIPAAVKA